MSLADLKPDTKIRHVSAGGSIRHGHVTQVVGRTVHARIVGYGLYRYSARTGVQRGWQGYENPPHIETTQGDNP